MARRLQAESNDEDEQHRQRTRDKFRDWLAEGKLDEREVDIKALQKAMGAGRLSFGKPELLMEVLGVIPGAVTPFGLINNRENRIGVFLDGEMMAANLVNFHPLRNDATTALTPADLRRFIAACGHDTQDLHFPLGEEGEA